MVDEVKKDKQEQEQKRKLWREQQAARIKEIKPRFLEKALRKGYQRRLGSQIPAQALGKATEEIEGRAGGAGSVSRRPAAILARLRAQQLRELKAKRAAKALPGGEAVAKIEEMEKIAQRLKSVYRAVNGVAGATFFGLIFTLLIMNLQLLFGNLLKAKLIPKLSLLEIIVVGFLDLLFLFILIILVVFIYFILNPCELAKVMSEWNTIAKLLGGTCKVVGKVFMFVKGLLGL